MSSTFFNKITLGGKLFFALILICMLLSCNNQKKTQTNENRIIVTDMLGRKVAVPKQIKRIVAHRSGALRLISYLQATDMLIGIEANERRRTVPYMLAHPELKELPLIGSGNLSDPELLAIINPDAIICTYLTQPEADELQNKSGIPVLCINYGDFNDQKEDFYKSLQFLGKMLSKTERADFLIHYIEENLKGIKNICDKNPKSYNVYVGGIAFRGAHGITSTEPRYAPFQYTNTINLAKLLMEKNHTNFSSLTTITIDKEQLIEWNPDKIFIDVAGYNLSKNDLQKDSVLGEMLSAVQQDEVYFLLPHIWNTINYEHILINTYYIAQVLNPDYPWDFKIEDKADEIYMTFLGKKLYKQILTHYGKGYQKINENE